MSSNQRHKRPYTENMQSSKQRDKRSCTDEILSSKQRDKRLCTEQIAPSKQMDKHICMEEIMSSKLTDRHSCPEDRNTEMKLRRRDAYGKISADRKEAMLLQRRTKELEAQKRNLSIESVVDCPVNTFKSPYGLMFSKQTALSIGESSTNTKKPTSDEVITLSSYSDKGKKASHPFCVFEKGSTSGTSNRQESVVPGIIYKDGKDKVANEVIEEIDEEKKLAKLKVIGGDILKAYKSFYLTVIHVGTKGEDNLVTWTLEHEKLN